MSKRDYNLSIHVTTMSELVHGEEKIHVDKSVYAIQTARSHTQFSEINGTMRGVSTSGNFSDSTSSFILFGVSSLDDENALFGVVYNSVCNLIGTTNGCKAICICVPTIKNLFSESPDKDADMDFFVEGIILGLRSAMKDCSSVIKTNQQIIYFAVPESMKESLIEALEKVE